MSTTDPSHAAALDPSSTLASEIVSGLAHEIKVAIACTRDLDHIIASGLGSARALAHARVRTAHLSGTRHADPACALAVDRALSSALDLLEVLTRALDRIRFLERTRDPSSALADEIKLACTLVRALASGLSAARHVDPSSTLPFAWALDLTQPLARILNLIDTRVPSHTSTTVRAHNKTKRVAPSAVSLLAAASRLLPATARVRFAEEYRSELWDLAESGAGSTRQLWVCIPPTLQRTSAASSAAIAA
jgi:hypothetical protein